MKTQRARGMPAARARTAHIRQASVTSAERTGNRPVTMPAASVSAPAPADVGANAGLRTRTGLVLVASGAILLLAVHIRTSFLNLQVAGLILVLTGVSWLSIPVRDKRVLPRRLLAGIRNYLEGDADHESGVRCPLSELLEPESDPAPDPASKLPPASGH